MIEKDYLDALGVVVQHGVASISFLQRKCSLGYNRAGKVILWMEQSGFVSPFDGSAKARKVLLTQAEYERRIRENDWQEFPEVTLKDTPSPLSDENGEAQTKLQRLLALSLVVHARECSIEQLQRKLDVSREKTVQIVEWMARKGYVSPATDDDTPRKVLLSTEDYFNVLASGEGIDD